MGIPLKSDDRIERDSNALLLVRLSKIADDHTRHSAAKTKASKLRDELEATVAKDKPISPEEKQIAEAMLLTLKKQIKLFLKQEESNSSFDTARPWE